MGFFAVRPDQRLLDAAVFFASHNNFSREDAWGHSGWRPRGFYYAGGDGVGKDWGGDRCE